VSALPPTPLLDTAAFVGGALFLGAAALAVQRALVRHRSTIAAAHVQAARAHVRAARLAEAEAELACIGGALVDPRLRTLAATERVIVALGRGDLARASALTPTIARDEGGAALRSLVDAIAERSPKPTLAEPSFAVGPPPSTLALGALAWGFSLAHATRIDELREHLRARSVLLEAHLPPGLRPRLDELHALARSSPYRDPSVVRLEPATSFEAPVLPWVTLPPPSWIMFLGFGGALVVLGDLLFRALRSPEPSVALLPVLVVCSLMLGVAALVGRTRRAEGR
jgi:hypothetical protein